MDNPWKYVKIPPEEIENNPYLNPAKAKEDTRAAAAVPDTRVTGTADFLVLEDIVCKGADGRAFEQYEKILVAKDVVRNPGTNEPVRFTPYQAITHFEQQADGLFLPSYALSCNILARLFSAGVRKEKNGEYTGLGNDSQKVLDQYLNYGPGYGWHAQNTIVNWKTREIIHYPSDSDFTSAGGSSNVNRNPVQTRPKFSPEKFGNARLEEALKDKDFRKYIQNLTGLESPEILIDIGRYFGRPARIWVPTNPAKANHTVAAWLGCGSDNFVINTYLNLDYSNAARGVRC